ncbi:sialidase family protein [Nonomuraea jabiensis]|uniref:Putative neuraminidase n=1 Tax=Nonomuraea jabiensis TaxID=882448 RepID=A0A7W9GB14_9ACTN|nr:exo-alpha-sialidase [Nonomuraea jabiensis]MBB5780502.1 putative neuraminidase [Nonomuraea jabiensis]
MSQSPTSVPDDLPMDGLIRVRDDDPDRHEAYLIAPAVQNHAANLMSLRDGDLGCVWFGGTQEGVSDISIWFSRLQKGADTWSTPARLSDDMTRSEQNPVLFPTPAGELWLLYTAQHAGNQDTAEVRRRISRDDGQTWGPVHTLFPATSRGGVFVRQPVLVLPSGRWLLPVFNCVTTPGRRWVGDRDTSSLMISDDEGRTWREQLVPESTGCVHMNVHLLADGTLLALFRSRWADSIYASRSADEGVTWSAPAATELPNNNSSIQYVTLRDGRLALVFNASSAADATERRVSLYDEVDDDGLAETPASPAEQEPAPAGSDERTAFWGAPRAPMTLALSDDGGRTWPIRRDLEVGDGYCLTNNSRDGLNREFSYPSIQETADGDLHIAFTYHRRVIKYVRVRPEWAAHAAGS